MSGEEQCGGKAPARPKNKSVYAPYPTLGKAAQVAEKVMNKVREQQYLDVVFMMVHDMRTFLGHNMGGNPSNWSISGLFYSFFCSGGRLGISL